MLKKLKIICRLKEKGEKKTYFDGYHYNNSKYY